MLLVDDEEFAAGKEISVDATEGSVIDDAHGSGELGLQAQEGADGDGGFVLVLTAGDVLDGEDDTAPVTVVAG
ncbi:hypothetical protein ABZ895_24170 [Streptomyces californicus]|uniref:hypothetical protein n=1 Tax=Streptomyces californicus TaxID=67351 RepID=UPI0033EF54BC